MNSRKWPFVVLAFMVTVASMPVGLAAGPATVDAEQRFAGRQVFDRWCRDCHGEGRGFNGDGLTGTVALAAKYEGRVPALLEKRTDLTPGFIAYNVRRGASVMPFFRKTEISDAELAQLAAYLVRNNPR